MIVEERNSAALNIQEVTAPDLEKLADVFLSKSWNEDGEKKPAFDLAISKLLKHLNVEYDLEAEIVKNYHLLWYRNEEVIGFTKVTDIHPGKEANVKFILFDDRDLPSEELEAQMLSSVERIFDKYQLERLLISLDTPKDASLEARLLDHYESFPIGYVHLSTGTRMHAILNKTTKRKTYFTYWL